MNLKIGTLKDVALLAEANEPKCMGYKIVTLFVIGVDSNE